MVGNAVLFCSSHLPFRAIFCSSFILVAFAIALVPPILSYKTLYTLSPLASSHPPTPEFRTSHHSWRYCRRAQYNCSKSSVSTLTFIGPCIANIFAEYNQQDATFHKLFISVRRSTCFRRFFRPSSGAQNCTYSDRYLSDRYYHLLLAWLATDSGIGLTNTWRCMCSFELLMVDGKTVWHKQSALQK